MGEHEVSLPSAKHADLLKQMMSTDGQQHPSVREAAQRAGFDLPPENSDIGQRVPSPAKLQPGDVIIGDKAQGVYTGDGRVYTTDGKEIPLSKMSMSGPHQGLFHLAAGDDVAILLVVTMEARSPISPISPMGRTRMVGIGVWTALRSGAIPVVVAGLVRPQRSS